MMKRFQTIAEEIAYKKIKELSVCTYFIRSYRSAVIVQKPDNECKLFLQEALARVNETFPSRLQISFNPKWQVVVFN
jgi:hypothetical protein